MKGRKRRSVLQSARADGDEVRRPPWALNYESGEGGGDEKGRRRGGDYVETVVLLRVTLELRDAVDGVSIDPRVIDPIAVPTVPTRHDLDSGLYHVLSQGDDSFSLFTLLWSISTRRIC